MDKSKSKTWKYLQVIKTRVSGRIIDIKTKVIYGTESIIDFLGANLARTVRTLRLKENGKWNYMSPAIKAGITDHIWTIQELLTTVVSPVNSV